MFEAADPLVIEIRDDEKLLLVSHPRLGETVGPEVMVQIRHPSIGYTDPEIDDPDRPTISIPEQQARTLRDYLDSFLEEFGEGDPEDADEEHPATEHAWRFCHAMERALQLSGEPMQVFPSEEAWEAFEEWRKRA